MNRECVGRSNKPIKRNTPFFRQVKIDASVKSSSAPCYWDARVDFEAPY
jgi:hypothetical protein